MARGTLTGQLAAMGFADTERAPAAADRDLGLDPDGADAPLVEALAAAADPDLALSTLARMAPDAELPAALRSDPGLRDRLITVLGASAALGDHLARHPEDWRLLAGPRALARPSAARPDGGAADRGRRRPGAADPVSDPGRAAGDPVTELRRAYRRRLLHLAARDLTGADPLDRVMAELADLADGGADGGAGHRAGRAAGRRRAGPAGRHRDGQVRRPGAELRQRRRRDLRGRAGRRRQRRRDRRRCGPRPRWPAA